MCVRSTGKGDCKPKKEQLEYLADLIVQYLQKDRLVNQSFLKVIVEDDGVGMDGDKVEKFNRGEKVFGSAGTAGEESFGIGLQHIRRMVAETDGKISVDSNLGEGTQFTITIGVHHL